MREYLQESLSCSSWFLKGFTIFWFYNICKNVWVIVILWYVYIKNTDQSMYNVFYNLERFSNNICSLVQSLTLMICVILVNYQSHNTQHLKKKLTYIGIILFNRLLIYLRLEPNLSIFIKRIKSLFNKFALSQNRRIFNVRQCLFWYMCDITVYTI